MPGNEGDSSSSTALSLLSGSTLLTVGAISDGQTLQRSGTTIAGATGVAPGGTASGDLSGTYPSPTVTQARGLRETAGPTTLTMGAVADGQFLTRSGSTIVGAAGGGIAGSTGSVDNSILRADGTGGATVQAGSGVTVSDAGVFAGGTWQGAVVAPLYGGGGTWRTVSTGTDTLVAGDGTVEYTVSCTITIAAASACRVGQFIRCVAVTAGITLTFARAGADTIDGGTANVAITPGTARAACGVTCQSSSAWGSVQPAVTWANRLKLYVSGGVAYAQMQVATDAALTVWADRGSPVAADSTTATLSGATATVAASTTTATPSATAWASWLINGSGGLSLTLNGQATILGAQYTGKPDISNAISGVGIFNDTPGSGAGVFAMLQEAGASDIYTRSQSNAAWTASAGQTGLTSVRAVCHISSDGMQQTGLATAEIAGGVFGSTFSGTAGVVTNLRVGLVFGRNGTTAGTATTTPIAYLSWGKVA